MRPFAQAAVIATHALIFFAPLSTSLAVTGSLTLTRFSRESFFFISAFVLTYTYLEPATMNLRHFWKRRLLITGLPYLTWTIIYYVFTTAISVTWFPFYRPHFHYLVSASGLHDFLTLLVQGYYQLYFIIVLFQFYVLFPLLLAGLRRAKRWHVHILVAAALWQIFYDEAIRHHLLPFEIGGKLETRLILSYPIYLLGGMIAALNYRNFHAWIMRNARFILVYSLAAAALAISLDYVRTGTFVSIYIAPQSDVLAPLAIMYNIGAIFCLYAFGVYLMSVRRGHLTRGAVTSTANASYGIYLSQMLWIPMLVRASNNIHLSQHVAWPLRVVAVVAVVFLCGYVMTKILERTPFAPAFVGHPQVRRHDRRTA
jgi:peptidoglycan/LPS O-acetylase OafA/YrhL